MAASLAQTAIQKFFSEHGLTKTYSSDNVVIHADQLPDHVSLLVSGLVKAYTYDRTGSKHLHMIFSPGKCFPLFRVLQNQANQVTCVAQNDIVVLQVGRHKFLEELEHNHELTRALLDQSVAQFQAFTNRIENLQYSSARERLLFRLLSLASSFGHKVESAAYEIDIGLTHEDLAASIQVSREVVTRQLRTLKAKQVVIYSRKKLALNPVLALSELRDPNLTLQDFNL